MDLSSEADNAESGKTPGMTQRKRANLKRGRTAMTRFELILVHIILAVGVGLITLTLLSG